MQPTENFVTFGHVVFETRERIDRKFLSIRSRGERVCMSVCLYLIQTDRHTDTLTTILRTPNAGDVMKKLAMQPYETRPMENDVNSVI